MIQEAFQTCEGSPVEIDCEWPTEMIESRQTMVSRQDMCFTCSLVDILYSESLARSKEFVSKVTMPPTLSEKAASRINEILSS